MVAFSSRRRQQQQQQQQQGTVTTTSSATNPTSSSRRFAGFRLTFGHGVIVTFLLAVIAFQMQLIACPSMTETSSTATNTNTASNTATLTALLLAKGTLTTDQLLTDARFYEREEIRGTQAQGNVFLGEFWFESPATAQIKIPPSSQLEKETLWELNDHQKQLLEMDNNNNGKDLDPILEQARCERYGYPYDSSRTKRRRIFYGATLADDSFFVLQTIATEAYNLYHTVSFIESNMTHTRSPREWRFKPGSDRLNLLKSMFGPNTNVSVDYFVPVPKEVLADDNRHGNNNFDWQFLQREAVLHRWKRNGMRPDDIGLLCDADELFSRDYLRALQICDVPELKPHQDCLKPKIISTTLMYEASPECILSNAKLWHPDAIVGECLEGIGSTDIHKPAQRIFYGNHAQRINGYGMDSGNYTGYLQHYNTLRDAKGNIMYPLWNAADYRTLGGGKQVSFPQNPELLSHNAYHLHNFFESTDILRHKYATYGEPLEKAKTEPLATIHDDLSVVVSCVHGWQNHGQRKYHIGGDQAALGDTGVGADGGTSPTGYIPRRPIFFDNAMIRKKWHEHLMNSIKTDEAKYGLANATCSSQNCQVHTREETARQ